MAGEGRREGVDDYRYLMMLDADQLKRFAPIPYVRSAAAKWEAQPFERATVEACITGLSDSSFTVRRAAAASLAERGAAAPPPPLLPPTCVPSSMSRGTSSPRSTKTSPAS